MSKPSFLNGNAIDFSLLRAVVKDGVSSLLQEIEGSKCVVLDMSLSRSINIILEGASIFKENNVTTFTKLSEEKIQTQAESILFICKPEIQTLSLVVNVFNDLRNQNSNYSYHLLLIPRKTQQCVDYLREQKVLPFITIHEIDADIIPIDNDLLSLEYNSSFLDLYVNNDETILKTLVDAILKIEIVFGPFKQIDGFGKNSRNLLNLLQECYPTNTLSNENPSQINQLLLIDRTADLASPFITPLTYEALIHEFLTFDCGVLSIEGSIVGKKENTQASIPLNSNDTLFSEIANMNISVLPKYLKEKSSEIQALYNSRPKDSSCSISEMNQFVKKVGTIQELSESLQIHLGIADQILSHTNSQEFGQKWQLERSILEGENCYDSIKSLLLHDISLEEILHYLILYSLINNGIKAREFDSLRQELLLTYGFQYLPLFSLLEKSRLLFRRDNSGNYNSVKKQLRLIREDIDGTQTIDLNYVTSGYAPISARLVQACMNNTSPLADIAKVLNCEYIHREQEATIEAGNNNTLIVFIGGVSFLEVTAIRLLKKLNPNVNFTILTTNIINGNMIIQDCCDQFKIVEKEEEPPLIQKQLSLTSLLQK